MIGQLFPHDGFAMERACKEFVRALSDAETTGATTDVFEIAKRIKLPGGATPLEVLEKCKKRGWVMGTANGAWLTPLGKNVVASGL
jgi:hypothetical protein